MKKDVIYIDIEDDITSIIDKVKKAGASIVALVPPKRAGVLQSAVNLRLLQKAAGTSDKRIVLITNDRSLITLAAGVKIPVAKNLQSKPEIAPITALEIDDEDIINGDELPIGDLAAMTPKTPAELADAKADKALASVADDELGTEKPSEPKRKIPSAMKVPDFDRFRKWLFIGGGAAVFLIIFLIWANVYAPRATVTITAKTTQNSIEIPITLDSKGETDVKQNVFNPIIKELKKTQSVEFDATGEKDVGEKAKGRIVFSNCETPSSQTIAAGTTLSVDGNNYVTTSVATVEGGKGDFISGCTEPGQSGQVAIQAADIGEDANTGSGTTFTVSGHGEQLSAKAVTAISGGSKKRVKVVTADDVAKAQEKLKDQNSSSAKDELRKKFEESLLIVNESFETVAAKPVSEPAVDQEATKAQLTQETTYKLSALKRDDVKKLLDAFLNEQIDGREDQRIYDNGASKLSFNSYNGTSVTLSTTGYTGPKIEEKQLAKELEGKRFGEIQQMVEAIRGVEDVHTDFWPFWVTSAPSPDKITIKFVVSNKTNE